MAQAVPIIASHTRTLPVAVITAVVVVVGTALPWLAHVAVAGSPNVHVLAIAFFFTLNSMIAFWEIALFRHITEIEAEFGEIAERYRGRELDRVIEFFSQRISLAEAASTRPWARVWATYSLFDPAYADKRSFGFTIDIGNGFTTLIPSLLIPWAVAFEFVPARALGIVMLILSWQMFYGAVLYYVSFVINRRHEGHTWLNLVVFVGLSNLIWLIFPLWTGLAAIWLIDSGTYQALGG